MVTLPALLGLSGVLLAALLGLLGVLRTGRPPAHLADIEGLKTLADEIKADRNDLREQVAALVTERAQMRSDRDDLRQQVTELRSEVTRLHGVVAVLEDRLGRRDA